MKKLMTLLIIICVLLSTAVCIPVSAAGATLGFSKADLRAGDSFSVTLNVSLSNALTVNGSFSYSGPVKLNSISGKIGTLDTNGNNIFVDLGNSTVNGSKAIVVANFTVNSNAAVGEKISVSFSGFFSNLNGDNAISGSESKTVLAPLANDNNLSSLTVKNATITPAFSASTTSYSASVPFEVEKLDIAATAADSKAKVSVNSPNLTPNGTTNVTVTVTAESGAKKTYTIAVKRAQDPNYKPSANSSLSEISVEGFLLSPIFNAEVENYVVWLPYETESVKISGSAADSMSSVEVIGGDKLAAGQDNIVKVVCTAENGTKKEYNVVVKRAAAHDGSIDPKPEVPAVDATANADNNTNEGIALWVLIVVTAGALIVGVTGGFAIASVLKKKSDTKTVGE